MWPTFGNAEGMIRSGRIHESINYAVGVLWKRLRVFLQKYWTIDKTLQKSLEMFENLSEASPDFPSAPSGNR